MMTDFNIINNSYLSSTKQSRSILYTEVDERIPIKNLKMKELSKLTKSRNKRIRVPSLDLPTNDVVIKYQPYQKKVTGQFNISNTKKKTSYNNSQSLNYKTSSQTPNKYILYTTTVLKMEVVSARV